MAGEGSSVTFQAAPSPVLFFYCREAKDALYFFHQIFFLSIHLSVPQSAASFGDF